MANLIAAVVAAGAGVTVWTLLRRLNPPRLEGAVLTPPMPAYDFHLRDTAGGVVSLSTFRGKVVALTFLYSHCPDVCPLIADNMRVTQQSLGGGLASRVAFVAISVDPRGDTPGAVREFLRVHRVEQILTFLIGASAELRPVWAHYFVGSDAKAVNPEATAASSPTPQQVGHTAIVYVIDPKGYIRTFLPGNFDPKDLTTDLRLLASGRVR
ncbi:MAG: SCO family protein [bacterium]